MQAASAQWFGERGLVCRIYSLHEALQIGCLLLLRFGEVVKYFDSVNVDSGGKQGWLSRYYQDFKIDFRV